MRLRVCNGLIALLAASCAAAPVCAELYKWMDERGVVTYSDRRPVDTQFAEKTQPVPNRISVYGPPHLDQAVLPPGAIAGTINAPGIIPGNTAGVLPGPLKPVPRGPLIAPRLFRDPLSPR